MTIEQWLVANVPSFHAREAHPISIEINNVLIAPERWAQAEFAPHDTVRIYPEPKGSGLEIAVWAVVAAVVAVGVVMITQKPLAVPKSGQRRGNELHLARTQGNQAKVGGIIREVAGRTRIFPDYLVPPRRYFQNMTEQWVEMLLCVGVGEFDINASDIRIGDTPISSLGSAATYQLYTPNANLSNDSARLWWHNCDEVGSTSTGGSGLTLTTTRAVGTVYQGGALAAIGESIAAPEGFGWFPHGWDAGMIVRAVVSYLFNFVNDPVTGITTISGPDIDAFGPFVGMPIEITGVNAGEYVIASYVPGSPGIDGQISLTLDNGFPVGGMTQGVQVAAIGWRGLRYRIISVSNDSEDDDEDTVLDESHGPSRITLERLTAGGTTDNNWQGFAASWSNDNAVSLDSTTQEGDWCGPFAACPPGEVVRRCELDFFFPSGLIRYTSKNGNPRQVSVHVEVQYRDLETAGPWTSVFWTFTATKRDQVAFTKVIAPAAHARYEFRVRRIGEESQESTKLDRVQWYGLRGRIDKAPSRYAGVTVMSVTVKGGTRLSAQSEQQISVVATRKLPKLAGGSWTAATASRDIASWVGYVVKSAGATDADIDLAELQRYATLWSSRGDYFDFAVEEAGTVKEALNTALAAGFAEFTLHGGRITPVRDEERTQFSHMYTPQNITEPLKRSFKLPAPDDYDGVDIKYLDGTSWTEETIKCRLTGDAGNRVEEITVDGITDRTRAWRYGMRKRRAQVYQTKSYSFGTELSALNSSYLGYVALADDIPGYAQSGVLADIEDKGDRLILSSTVPFTFEAGKSHVIGLRKPDGRVSGPWPATRVDDYRVSVASLDFAPDLSFDIEPPHLLFGVSTRWCYPALITSIAPGDYSAEVEAVNYDARIYADDNNTAPESA